MSSAPLIASIEAGGTKFVCAVATSPDDIRAEFRIPTTKPDETLEECCKFFTDQASSHGSVSALGIGTFGPAGVNQSASDYGFITSTPKRHWQNVNLLGTIRSAIGDVPAAFDTDVNAAAVGEWKWGAGRGVDSVLYITVGTGIGGGLAVNGQPLHGLVHPEMGHIRIPRVEDDPFVGNCPFHRDCFEGLASGPAIEKRWGQDAVDLPKEHPAWGLQAEYLSLALVNLICALSPERIVLGGGVMEQLHLFPLIRRRVVELLANYISSPSILSGIDDYIVPPGLGNQAGLAGGIALGAKALDAV